MSRLRIINGGGRSEVQAAHIWPVADGGPDVVQNGIALSATIHWLFDRHLISFSEDYHLLVAHNRVPSELRSLFGEHSRSIHLPANHNAWPHPSFIARHREKFSSEV
ncbi:MAG: HNH endonuclease [Novosphingobium sp.]